MSLPIKDLTDKLSQLIDLLSNHLVSRTNDYVVRNINLGIARTINTPPVIEPPLNSWFRWYSIIANTGTFNIILNDPNKDPIPVPLAGLPAATMDFHTVYITNAAQAGLAFTILCGLHKPYEEIKNQKWGTVR